MFIGEREVKRIVSVHFKEKYHLDVDPDRMEWDMRADIEMDMRMDGLEIDDRGALSYLYQGGDVDGEDDEDSPRNQEL